MPRYHEIPWRVLFWKRVRKERRKRGCWVYTGHLNKQGYGQYGDWGKGHRAFEELGEVLAHRIAWVLHNQCPIPKGQVIRHKVCGNPPCVNPTHLEAGSNADNSRDMVAHGKSTKGIKHPHHKLTVGAVLRIRALKGTCRGAEIARMFKVSRATVCRVLARKTWGHI